jgi:hypothetical protein
MRKLSRSPSAILAAAVLSSMCLGGCAWLSALQETEPEPDFPAWSQGMSGSRPTKSKAAPTEPKSKSLFFNERSREVEKSIGYEP